MVDRFARLQPLAGSALALVCWHGRAACATWWPCLLPCLPGFWLRPRFKWWRHRIDRCAAGCARCTAVPTRLARPL